MKQLVPVFAPLETYQLTFSYDASPYFREYKVYPSLNVVGLGEADDGAEVFIRQHPDAHGNIVSPTSSVFELGNAHLAFVELAVKAETVRAKQSIVTQPAEKKSDADPLGSASMFFDSESREIQSGLDRVTNEEATEALNAQIKLCSIINRLQSKGDSADRWM